MGRFCAKCGKEEVSGKYIHGLCKSCFWEGPVQYVPTEFALTFCKSCLSHLQGKKWVRQRAKKADEDLIEAARIELMRIADIPEGTVIAKADGTVTDRDDRGLPKTLVLKVALKEMACGTCTEVESVAGVAYTFCSECDSASRGIFGALVQIRSEGRTVDEEDRKFIDAAFASTEKKTRLRNRQEVTEIKEKEGGIDVKFVSLHTARIFTRDLFDRTGATISEHPQLIGLDKDDGSRAYRNTIAVRFPRLRRGTVMEYDGKAYQVVGVDKGMFSIENVAERYDRINLTRRELERARLLKRNEVRRVRLDAKAPACGTLYDLEGERFIEVLSEIISKHLEKGEEGIMLVVGGREQVYKAVVPWRTED